MIFRPHSMKIPFPTGGRRWLVLASVVALMIGYVGLAATQFAAAWLGNRVQLNSLRRAAWLDPGNADYRDHLGRYYDLVARDPATAVAYYHAAAQLNPHSARYWFDLASAYQVLGDAANQTIALERAIMADSMTPDVAWEAANLYLVEGENEKALREFRVVLANDASLAPTAIQFCWRIRPDVDALLRDVVPPIGDAYVAFLILLENDTGRLLREVASATADADADSQREAEKEVQTKLALVQQETSGSAKVWQALMQTHQTFERRQAFEYFRYLVQQKDVDEAVLVWQQTAELFGLSSYLPLPNNLIVNSSFSLPPINAGFDWQYHKQGGVEWTLDPTEFHSGQRSLLIAVDGPGISDAGLTQFVAVQPNTTYDFSAYYKSGEQQGAGALHFTVQDMYSQTVYYESDDLKEASFWKAATGEFTTGPDCKLVLLHVRRLPAGSPIRVKLWIDDFHLTRKPS
jgi:tetratricopeptide (TPR) repeat protein